MPKGYFLGIGLNRLDPAHYGSEGILRNPVNDARAMLRIARTKGFTEPDLLVDQYATAEHVTAAIESIARRATPEDLIVIAYSGHGSQIPDASGLEEDGLDETFCLFDRMMPGAEFHRLLATLPERSRVAVFIDACHSGTFVRGLWAPAALPPATRRSMLRSDALAVYAGHRALYDDLRAPPVPEIGATVFSLSACGDAELASDGAGDNGAFTAALLNVWGNGWDRGNYRQFVNEIAAKINDPRQVPEYREVTWADPDFESQSPFQIEAA